MFYKVTQKDSIAEQLLPMSELNEHLRVDDVTQEEIISVYRDAAIDFAEQFMNRALGLQTIIATFEQWKPRAYLPLGNIQEIDVVTALDEQGDEVVLDERDYRFNAVSNMIIIDRHFDKHTEFMITYQVGNQVEDIPKAIKLGIMKLVSTWYENREDISNGVSVAEIPFNHKACFNLYRIPPAGE
ncbi:head-tail connector protein [Photobacterium swingsii]|uniref:head-tail connector protein n=1 Tax=Photobacterium swingsii TaxID=680026 RepID=UPI003D0BE508